MVTAQKKNTFFNLLNSRGKTIHTFSVGNYNIPKSERKRPFYLKEIVLSNRYLIRAINNKPWILMIKGSGRGRRTLQNIVWQLHRDRKKRILSIIDYTHNPFNGVRLKRAPRK